MGALADTGAPRRLMHQRSLQCDAYLREDGLWEVEVRLRDTKPFGYTHFRRGEMRPGDAVHDMMLRVAVDDDMTIRDVGSEMFATPFLSCHDVRPLMGRLTGLKLSRGWREAARQRIGRLETCTHLMDLLAPAVATLYQTVTMGKNPENRHVLHNLKPGEKPFYLNGCYSWREDGDNVANVFPDFTRKPAASD